ncbi:hypothetical protein D3C75_1135380 [compost metagenome]
MVAISSSCMLRPCRAEASTNRADEVPNTPASSRSVWAIRSADACIWGARVPPRSPAKRPKARLTRLEPTKRAASISSSLTETRA